MKDNLVIINNEKCIKNNNEVFCENIEIKLLAEDLEKFYNLSFILRRSKVKPIHRIKRTKVSLSSNILFFLYEVISSIFKKNSKYLIISITPYTFLSFLIILLFQKKTFLYLRSDGYKEVNFILGKKFLWAYKIMEIIMIKYSHLITVNSEISRGKNYKLVNPSSIDQYWSENLKEPDINNCKLLYVGRLKVEKGVYSLINIFKEYSAIEKNASLTLVGHGNFINNKIDNIKILPAISEKKELIKVYDNHNIFILPSFTEGHPRVLIESLSRKRPIIIFDDIKHVKNNFKGVFVSKRDSESLAQTINHIFKNYKDIQKSMEKNIYPTREKFIKQLIDILKN